MGDVYKKYLIEDFFKYKDIDDTIDENSTIPEIIKAYEDLKEKELEASKKEFEKFLDELKNPPLRKNISSKELAIQKLGVDHDFISHSISSYSKTFLKGYDDKFLINFTFEYENSEPVNEYMYFNESDVFFNIPSIEEIKELFSTFAFLEKTCKSLIKS